MTLRTIAAVLPPRPALFELGVVAEVFGIDRTEDGVPPMELRICAEVPGVALESAQPGFLLTATHGLDALEDADLVCVPAYSPDLPVSPAVIDAVRRAHERGAWILSVCSGAFLLGEAGLLEGRRCTTHWRHAADLASTYPNAKVDPGVLFVEDDRVITSAGTAAGIDACLHHVRCELGAAAATTIARRMVVPPQRDGGQRQYVDLPIPTSTSETLEPLLTWMREHLDQEQPIRELAKRSSMSERTFARRFAAETGTTPARWLLLQRLHHARHLLESTDVSIEAVAQRCGFGSAALLRHHFHGHVGVNPGDYRRSFACRDEVAG